MSTFAKDYVFDVIRLRSQFTDAFRNIFADPNIVKILHGCDSDLQLLAVTKKISLFIERSRSDVGQRV